MYIKRFETTIVAPVGVLKKKLIITPITTDTNATIALATIEPLKLFAILNDVSAGKIVSPEIKSAPITLMPRTITIAVITERITL